MQIIGNANIFQQGTIVQSKGNGSSTPKEPVDSRIRSLENRIDGIDANLNRNMKDMDQLRTQLFAGIQVRDKHQVNWKRFGIIAVVTGLSASALGGGIPTLIMMGVSAASAIAGGVHFMKEQNLNSNLKTITAEMTYKSGSNSVDDIFAKAERNQLAQELAVTKQEKAQEDRQEMKKMVDAVKEDKPETDSEKKTGIIEDLGNLIKINGITLFKKKK